jgi:hypothetical protein
MDSNQSMGVFLLSASILMLILGICLKNDPTKDEEYYKKTKEFTPAARRARYFFFAAFYFVLGILQMFK